MYTLLSLLLSFLNNNIYLTDHNNNIYLITKKK